MTDVQIVPEDKGPRDVVTDLEALLYPEDAPAEDEPQPSEEEGVEDDAQLELLPDDSDSDSDDEGSEDTDEGEVEEPSLGSLLGIDDERIVEGEDGSLLFNAIIDGEAKPVPLEDLAASYQLQGHVNKKSMALENERKEFQEVREKVSSDLQQKVEGLTKLGEMLETELLGQYNSINWDQLRNEDPAQWAALRQEFSERAVKVEQAKGLVDSAGKQLSEDQQKQQSEVFQKHMKEQFDLMIAANPSWADNNVREQAFSELTNFLVDSYGYKKEEVNVTDHRLFKVFQDAKAYRDSLNGVAKKKVKQPVPKFQKPGSRTNAAALTKARAAKALIARRKKTGSVNDVAASIRDRM